MSFVYVELPDLVHSVAMQLEGGSHPAAARALITAPVEGAQLGATLGTQELEAGRQEETGGGVKGAEQPCRQSTDHTG